jgi:hypothetical protein
MRHLEVQPERRQAFMRALVASATVLVIGLPIAIVAQSSSGPSPGAKPEDTPPTSQKPPNEEPEENLLRVRRVGPFDPEFSVFQLAFEGRLAPKLREPLQRVVDAWIQRGLESEFGGLPIETASEELDVFRDGKEVSAEWFVDFGGASQEEGVRALKPAVERFLINQALAATLRLGQGE